ncbi:hypothetical protein M3Y94_00961900 [Aphelenchoides besseyi]|nr:hypothetical protein M3Y94_00961900 [Aphelenchoides besseyi]KAI6224705.1 hypothetical protein M3Y95_00780700 [Aphelenchoides besseyi]
MERFYFLLALTALVNVGTAVGRSCYQSMYAANVTVNLTPSPCPTTSESCFLSYDRRTHMITRGCQTSKCVMYEPNTDGGCYKVDSPQEMIVCCCYLEACNRDIPLSFLTSYLWNTRNPSSSTIEPTTQNTVS